MFVKSIGYSIVKNIYTIHKRNQKKIKFKLEILLVFEKFWKKLFCFPDYVFNTHKTLNFV